MNKGDLAMKIQEMAKLAGVSPSTVSRVFSNHRNVSGEVRERVFALARAHGYHPRLTGKQRNVVIVTPYNSVYPVQSCVDMLLMALTQALPLRGFRVEILPVNNLERLNNIQFCAAAAIGVEQRDFPEWAEHFAAPLLILDRSPGKAQENVFFVHSDEKQGMETAVAHLRDCGCRKIGCLIHGTDDCGNAAIRRKAILEALNQYAFPAEERLVCFTGIGSDAYVELTGKMLRYGVDAFFCPGGNAGIVLPYALSLYNRKIPEDISLIASEQTFYSRFAVPPQTTITQDYPGLADAVCSLIENLLDNRKDVVLRETVLPYRLIVRESVSAGVIQK